MMGNIYLKICTVAVPVFVRLTAFARQMQMKGSVVDKATGKTIIGASVRDINLIKRIPL